MASVHIEERIVSMESKGIMQEIREHLAQGRSGGEVIAMGYAPPTVYKIQRSLRRGREGQRRAVGHGRATTPVAAQMPAGIPADLLSGGSLAVMPDESGIVNVLWHAEPPVPCPGCRRPVVHWSLCPHCNKLIPEGCACPQDSPSVVEGYTFQQIGEALANP